MQPAKWYLEKRAEKLLNLKEFEIQIDPNSSKETRLVVAKEVMEQDAEIDRQLDVRTEEIADEIEDKKSTSELSDPNKW